jgi:hypothetical protein
MTNDNNKNKTENYLDPWRIIGPSMDSFYRELQETRFFELLYIKKEKTQSLFNVDESILVSTNSSTFETKVEGIVPLQIDRGFMGIIVRHEGLSKEIFPDYPYPMIVHQMFRNLSDINHTQVPQISDLRVFPNMEKRRIVNRQYGGYYPNHSIKQPSEANPTTIHDVGGAHTSSGRSPDDAGNCPNDDVGFAHTDDRKATTSSSQSEDDPSFARTSWRPSFARTSWLCHDRVQSLSTNNQSAFNNNITNNNDKPESTHGSHSEMIDLARDSFYKELIKKKYLEIIYQGKEVQSAKKTPLLFNVDENIFICTSSYNFQTKIQGIIPLPLNQGLMGIIVKHEGSSKKVTPDYPYSMIVYPMFRISTSLYFEKALQKSDLLVFPVKKT